jgi:hypothetical protein
MLIEECVVSAKTPRDGKLEVSPDAAHRLRALGTAFVVRVADRWADGRLSRLECTCARRSEGTHVHHFVESPVLMGLMAGARVEIEMDAASGEITIASTD